MRIAVVGGTGALGRHVVRALEAAGHDARALSRSSAGHPVDLTTGEGLDRALEGCEAVVDASNGLPSPGKARPVLVEGSRRLLDAAQRAGARHHVCVSIIGIDAFPLAYYRVKLEQEAVVRDGPVPWTIVRANQFHGLVAGTFAAVAGRARVVPAFRGVLQPVAAADVAEVLAEVAAGEPARRIVTVAGPEVRELGDLARAWKQAKGRRAPVVRVPLPGGAGRALRGGALTCPDPDHRGATTFDAWVSRA